ncbi:hypothetical protein [Streptomyces glaucus]|uniref:PknH-like extracellular domain-containing protein n=1 Tax=Streptomyces glaucus TaxID=284029 RepID=A0ABP5WE54_9ACTN
MSRTTSQRTVRLAVLTGVTVLTMTAAYAVTQYADASQTPAPPASTAANRQVTAPAAQQSARPTSHTSVTPANPASTLTPTQGPSQAPEHAEDTTLAASRVDSTQLPDSAEQKWKELAPPSTRKLSQDFQLNECVKVHGATAWQQQGFISAHKTPAVQDSLAFQDEASARSAFRQVLADMDTCEATSRNLQKRYGLSADVEVGRTATVTDGAAWSRTWTAVEGLSAPGAQANHIYAVQRGAVLVLLHFDEWDTVTPRTYDPAGDADVLATLSR